MGAHSRKSDLTAFDHDVIGVDFVAVHRCQGLLVILVEEVVLAEFDDLIVHEVQQFLVALLHRWGDGVVIAEPGDADLESLVGFGPSKHLGVVGGEGVAAAVQQRVVGVGVLVVLLQLDVRRVLLEPGFGRGAFGDDQGLAVQLADVGDRRVLRGDHAERHLHVRLGEVDLLLAFLGDGEMDEPESKGAITIATREKLDNLVFVINCNLQRLDGPVTGNGKIINELEGIFEGAGWNVIKVMWGSRWDELLRKDTSGKLIQLMNETVDGDYQTFKSKDGAYVREHFFGKYPETAALVADWTDEQIWALNRGGHDPKKIYAAFKKAQETKGKATVILAHTIKGYGMGDAAEGKNIAHQVKKMNMDGVRHIRDRFNVPVSDADIEKLPYITFPEGSEEHTYLHAQRQKLHGYLPSRQPNFTEKLELPSLQDFGALLEEQSKEISTTIAFVRALNVMLKNKSIKDRLVPIIADEARTFGMEGLFRQIGIYSPNGQQYTPQDREQVAYYKEDEKGQILQEGINELGAGCSWLAAATSYSTNNLPMIPFYIYYSMFGFQRIGDLCWAAGDQQARGFLIGGTSGRTTLNGEGLQHEDGHSHIQSLTIPNCISYDPAYAYEVAVIMHDGLERMYGEKQENVYYYITTLNENYHMPAMPEGAEEGIRKGIYKLETIEGSKGKVQLLGSGSILRHVREAAEILAKDYGVGSDVYSVTSFTELARDGQDCERWNMLHPLETPRVPYIAQVMNDAPAVASTDYMKLFAEQVRTYVPADDYRVLGTDGFGRSDSRENLRHHFEVDASYVVVAALGELAKRGEIDKKVVADAIAKFNIDADKVNPRLA